MKNYQKFIILLACISLIVSITFILQTYAKYSTVLEGHTNVNIAKWSIKVNDVVVTSDDELSEVLKPIFEGNAHIAPDVIAPTATGYFLLDFDFEDVEVSFHYEITIEVADESAVKKLEAFEYYVDDDLLPTPFSGPVATISGDIYYEDIVDPVDPITSRLFTIWIQWANTGEPGENAEDTLVTIDPENLALFKVTVSFIQIPSPAPGP